MTRVLVALSPLMYREILALSIHLGRPDLDVRFASPEVAGREIAGFCPHLLVHDAAVPISATALAGVPYRAGMLYPDGLDIRVGPDGSAERIEDATTEDLLRIVDRAVACGEAAPG